MKKLITLGIGVGLLAVFISIGTTSSFLKSQAISEDNVISTGTVEVVLSDDNETRQVAIGESWGHLESSAGERLAESEIKIINQGTLNSNHLEIQFQVDGDLELAKHIIFDAGNGLLLGSQRANSENLVLALLGQAGQGYRLENPAGTTITTLDGMDATTPDGKLSLSELNAAGIVRIRPYNSGAPMQAGSTASLWLNAYIDPDLTVGGQTVNTSLSFTLEQ